ncbi:DUF86 domain-containing protein [Bacillus marinisedimentorum]|uniref:DUF86 domain-containing protein n=1 Tax=Bacillus marinisedimentorum TaxID=1821260 RepID=UPI0008720581|nr:DUF86 domain-containing protein [Bacillus marinisedimentorum]
MYFVDRGKIESTLSYMEKMDSLFKQHDSWESSMDKLALERIVHMMIEAVIDVGNAMIDGFIMRDPGSYEDIISIMLDEKVVTEADAKSLTGLIRYRKGLVQEYTSLDHAELVSVLNENAAAIERFPASIRRYLDEELGPVSAFSPH